MIQISHSARRLFQLALLLAASGAQAAGPTGFLNDTGQTKCYGSLDPTSPCNDATTGDSSANPRQDGRFGRDAASKVPGALVKIGGGAAGFDFTPLDASGNAIALTGSPAVPAVTPSCTKDNVTNLIWEIKPSAGLSVLQDRSYLYAWGSNVGSATCGASVNPCNTDAYILALNAANHCGFNSGWRLPTRRELLSIVHAGISVGPMIDVNYFPDSPVTYSLWHWTSDTYATYSGKTQAWFVGFEGGSSGPDLVTHSNYVRLVRNGP